MLVLRINSVAHVRITLLGNWGPASAYRISNDSPGAGVSDGVRPRGRTIRTGGVHDGIDISLRFGVQFGR